MTATYAPAVHERPVWAAAVSSFLPVRLRAADRKLVAELPVLAVLVVQAILMLRMTNGAFQDEALYINVGHAYLDHLSGGPAAPAYGGFLSGVPGFYPVLAAAMDQVGGLVLVRLFSAACMLTTTWLVYRTGTFLWGRRSGLVGSALYAVNGSVLFVGVLATYDALCVVAIASAAFLAITRHTLRSAAACAVLLIVAIMAKYTGVAFVPLIAAMAVVSGRPARVGIARAVLIVAIPAACIVVSLLTWGRSLVPGIEFTTVGRHALTYESDSALLGVVIRDSGPLLVVAVCAAAMAVRSWRSAALVGLLLVAALALPVGQIRIHEYTSLDKHMAYGGFFLAVLGGRAIRDVSLRSVRVLAVLGLAWLLVLQGMWRSDGFFNGWPNVSRVVESLRTDNRPGTYLAFEADSFQYYLEDEPDMHWQTAYGLFDEGQAAVLAAVHAGTYEGFVFRTDVDGMSPQVRTMQAAAMTALEADPRYRRIFHARAQHYQPGYWFVWERVN